MGNVGYNEPASFEEMGEQESPVTQSETVTPESPKVETNETTE